MEETRPDKFQGKNLVKKNLLDAGVLTQQRSAHPSAGVWRCQQQCHLLRGTVDSSHCGIEWAHLRIPESGPHEDQHCFSFPLPEPNSETWGETIFFLWFWGSYIANYFRRPLAFITLGCWTMPYTWNPLFSHSLSTTSVHLVKISCWSGLVVLIHWFCLLLHSWLHLFNYPFINYSLWCSIDLFMVSLLNNCIYQ